jgi:hypothetical protein
MALTNIGTLPNIRDINNAGILSFFCGQLNNIGLEHEKARAV